MTAVSLSGDGNEHGSCGRPTYQSETMHRQCTWTANTTDTAADAAGGDDDATKLILMTLMLKSS